MTTLTLDLSEAEATALRAIAEAPADVRKAALQEATRVLRRSAATNGANGHGAPMYGDGNAERIARQLAALDAFEIRAREYSADAPPLSDYAVSRDAIYEGRGA